jgi:hypothetical protein
MYPADVASSVAIALENHPGTPNHRSTFAPSALRAAFPGWILSGLALVTFAACGRIDFADSRRPGACPALVTAPDPFTVSGATFTFTGFQTTAPVPSVAITAFDATTGAAVATTTSAGDGTYTLEIGGGTSRALRLDLVNSQYLTTHEYTGVFLDGDLASYRSPLWGDGSMSAIYGAGQVTWDQTKGNIDIAIEQCDGTPIDGATVTVSPPPGTLEYLRSDGAPDPALTSTTMPYSSAVGFNVVPGPIHITASKPGLAFDDVDMMISGGGHNNVIVMRAYE